MNLRNQEQSKDRELATMASNYKKAIDFITEPRDWKEVCIIMAKEHPDIFVATMENKYNACDDVEDLTKIKEDIIGGRKISAIKAVRQLYDLGLKDAKTVVDTVEHNFRVNDVAVTNEGIKMEAGKYAS